MTSYVDAYDMGYQAFLNGAFRNDNPFNPNEEALQYEGWITGWVDCKEEEY